MIVVLFIRLGHGLISGSAKNISSVAIGTMYVFLWPCMPGLLERAKG